MLNRINTFSSMENRWNHGAAQNDTVQVGSITHPQELGKNHAISYNKPYESSINPFTTNHMVKVEGLPSHSSIFKNEA